MRKLLIVLIPLLVLGLVLGGCGGGGGGAPTATPTPAQQGLPNPAAVNCLEKGGQYEIRTGPDGSQWGVCIFPDGSECDAWAFFRGECSPGND